ncbi:hypothetical protein GBF38_008692 [Nibea albiflora]|uniref:Uncharacterized protein n=1 Tax=Nibea albiflora TaxID=240163 RepID=A0ACB7EQH6_NIBAL|nr:hypothetical protein GBF38_008692 [Nibea albiflora]
MACTAQSALAYVKSWRVRLVRELKNLSVIVENLYQQGVFQDEEVSKIQAEKDDYDKARHILDSVTKKGEEACYRFLKIIDTTRKRTLGRLPEGNTEASTQKLNLHTWISCFSFKEDPQMDVMCFQGSRPCHEYQRKLKIKTRKISSEFWKANKRLFGGNKPDLSFLPQSSDRDEEIQFIVNLLCAAEREQQTGEKTLKLLASVCTYQTLPLEDKWYDFQLDLYSHDPETGLRVLPSLQSVFQSAPAVWSIDLSQRKTSILLEVLKLQSEKKRVKLTGCSHEESEVRSLLQCLPYISQLSFLPQSSDRDEEIQFIVNLLCAAEREQQTGEKTLKLLASVCTYQTLPLEDKWYDFQLDLYSHDPETGLRVLPSLQSVFQSAPAVWSIDLSQRKTSILLEVLKLQSEKKRVKLTGCSHEESEVRSLLQCLPYISQLSFSRRFKGDVEFFVNLLCAAEREQQTGEKTLKMLASVCTHQRFPFDDRYPFYHDHEKKYQSDFLLDVFSHVKDCETKTGLRVLPSLQSVFQSAPAVWSIDLSQRKTSILLEVLKLQSEKKRVKLTGCSHEESEVRSLLQCLPYISQLSFLPQSSDRDEEIQFIVNLLCAAEREQQTGEKTLKLLASVCTYQTLPLEDNWYDFQLDLYSHDPETGLRVLPSLQSVFQSAPAVWSIDLSQRKTSILLEVLKLQSEKKRVELTGCSHEESEVRSLLQCLPYISQLSLSRRFKGRVEFFVNLLCAAEREQQTGEKTLKLLASVCTYQTFPFDEEYMDDDDDDFVKLQSDFLLDLFSHVKDCETKTGLRVLPSLQSVFQSAPAVWFIDLSERQTSILLEVLKLQSEKKRVELTGCSHEESEVRSLLQCLPYISQLSFSLWFEGDVEFFVNLLCAAEREQQTGEKTLKLLASVCTHQRFPFDDRYPFYHDHEKKHQSDFLLDVFSHVKDCETKTGLRVLPSLQSVFQSAPAVWFIDLSQRKTSILLEVLKLQSEKKRVELTGCSHEESEVRSLLQCLPYISQLSFYLRFEGDVEFFVNLLCAAEREQQTGEKTLKLLASVCTHQTFPFDEEYMDDDDDDDFVKDQSDFLLDLFSHVKDCEAKTGLRVLPSLQSVFQSAPAVWSIDLSERKTSILLEVLKLQSEKKRVKLTGCSHEESEVRSLLQCLPYISQLSCDPDFFQTACTSISVRSREEAEQLSSLLKLLGSNLLLTGQLSRKTCRLSSDLALLLFRWVRRGRVVCPLALEELCLSPQTARASERGLSKVVSSLASLLRCWAVRQLDLTEFCVPAQDLIPLLLHDGPLTIKLSKTMYQELLSLLYEIQDEVLTRSFLSKVGGDLSSCCLNWELLHHLLQQSSAQTITVNLRKNLFLQESITRLLPFLDRIVFKRSCPSFVLTAIREIFKARDSLIVPSLLRSLGHVINLTCREMDSVDCAALIFTLKHSDGVRLNLLWTSIPAGGAESILLTLDKVSQLSVDRKLLLRFVHCCAASEVQQGAAVDLLRTVQHRLDLSCSSCVELSQEGQSETLSLTAHDCRAVSTILRRSSRKTRLDLQDCEVEDSGLDLLLPVLDRVRLRASKAVLLQLVSLVPVSSERDTVRRAVSLCTALGGELDLSHTTLDQNTCAGLAQMLDFSDVLTELDLSHCELTDQLLLTLITHLHKVQVLDLSHNKISDASADMLLRLVSINPSIHTVRLFSNNIVDRKPFERQRQFEIW